MPTLEQWLDRLAAALDNRRPRLARLRSYMDGNAPLPEGAEGVREAYRQFQKKARTNFGELVVDAVAERMIPAHFRVGDSSEDDDTARRIWKRNRLPVWCGDVHRDMLGPSVGYVAVQNGEDGVEISYERPEQVIVDHDPRRPDKRRAALKVYADDAEGVDVAFLHLPGFAYRFKRAIPTGSSLGLRTASGGAWRLDGVTETGLSTVPFVPFVNRGGMGEFETHIDLLDRINWDILERLVIVAMQAYRQRATKGDLPEKDEEGNPIDYGALFRPGPGALWNLPDGVELWESAQTDLTGILDASKEDVRQLAAVTRTPMSMLMPDSTNQSAEGASFAREGLVFKTEDRIERAKVSWSEVLRLALTLELGSAEEVPEIDVDFLPPERQSMAERYDALSKAGADVPWRTKMRRILQFDGDEIDRIASERAEDAMLAATLAASGQPASAVTSGDNA